MASASVILALDAPGAELTRVGGKGANLARLARAGFAVPDGFVVTADAYAAFVTANGLGSFVLATAGDAASSDPDALDEASKAIRARFASSRMPTDLESALRDAHARLGAPAVAVRSSATAEDLPEMSFAGQQDTYLNVVGANALLEAVVRCWSSLWTARALGYRARNEIPAESVSMAVVVQAMVRADASGVLFTANPLNGKRTEIVIDAGLGLGEALVSGHIEADHYVATPDGSVLSKTLGRKAVSVRARSGGGTETLSESADAARHQALPDAAITELVRLGTRVAALYGEPQNIEWAWDGRQLQLLQTRPITSLFPVPRGLKPTPVRILFSFGAVQGMLEPMTPLGRDTICGLAAGASRLFGLDYTLDTQPALHVAAERLFIDLTEILGHPVGRRLFPRALQVIEPATARVLELLRNDPRLLPRRRKSARRTLPRFVWLPTRVLPRVLFTLVYPEASRARLERLSQAFLIETAARCDRAQSLAERVRILENTLERVPAFVIPTFLPRLVAGLGSLNALRLLSAALPDVPNPLETTRGLPHNVTTEMDLALWRTAMAIRADRNVLERFGTADAADLAADYLGGRLPTGAQEPVAAFLGRYGMRGVAEIDLGRARWRDDPTPIIQVLRSYLQIEDPAQGPEATFARGAISAEAAIARMVQTAGQMRGGWMRRPLVRWVGRRMRALAGLRESPKFFVIRVFGMLRATLLASGRALASAGTLDRPDDIFYLHVSELRALGSGETRDWKTLIGERRAHQHREARRRQIPRLMFSDGQAFYEGLGAADSESELTGSPVSPGVVEGVAHVMLDPRSAHLAPGEILVCPATDPGWTPLFLAAGGLVMEVGGLMTHGAVVAREYGIPAVVGVHEVTTRLRSGQRVRVDGSTGRIVILQAED